MSLSQEARMERKRKTCLNLVRKILGKTSWVRQVQDGRVSHWVAGAGSNGGSVAVSIGLDDLEIRLRRWVEDVSKRRAGG